jgi:two-component system, LuxR family, response regulator FixJ
MSDALDPVVYVVDDEAPLRNALALLARSVQLKTQLFASAQEFLDAWKPGPPACLVLDVRMPGMSGIELLERLRGMHAPLPVIVMTGHGDVAMAVRAMKAGALDFIEKPFNDQTLLDLVHTALAQAARGSDRSGQRLRARGRLARLSPREREILAGITEGLLNKQIADRLGLSTRTVELHRAHIMEKSGAKSASELVRIACQAEADEGDRDTSGNPELAQLQPRR